MVDDFRFLRPWTMVLPDRFPCLLSVAGHGGKTTLLRRLHDHYREQSRRVLWARSAPGPLPAGSSPAEATTDASELGRRLDEQGHAHLDPGADVGHAIDPDRILEHGRDCGAEVILVEAQASCGSLLWPDAPVARWPQASDLCFLVANLGALGRLRTAEVVHGAPARLDGEDRVGLDDLLGIFVGEEAASRDAVPEGCACIPFLTGFGALRDVDAMFDLGRRLWEHPGHTLLCFGELEGDARRDAAERQQVAGTVAAEQLEDRERVYALYPARLDAEEGDDSSMA